MMIKDFLIEYKASPNILLSRTKNIPALVGMEFEMIIPRPPIPDFNIHFISDVESHISKQEYKNFHDQYIDYLKSTADDLFDNDENEIYKNYVEEISPEDISDDEFNESLNNLSNADKNHVRKDWISIWIEDHDDADHEKKYLKWEGIKTFTDFIKNQGMDMPTIRDYAGCIKKIAKDIQKIGIKVNYGTEYHGVKRTANEYALEPDTSMTADYDYIGLELVSPPMPTEKMIIHLKNILAWMKDYGCKTDNSTGLHMNVSIKGKNLKNLNYIKLCLLSGDKYILDQFSRASNHYCQSSFDKIKTALIHHRAASEKFLNVAKSGFDETMNEYAKSLFGAENHGNSINLEHAEDANYVEFRAPGGNWLQQGLDKLLFTLTKYIVTLNVALSPDMNKKEYLKKWGAMLASLPSKNNELYGTYVKFMTGRIDILQTKNILRRYGNKEYLLRVRYVDVNNPKWIWASDTENPLTLGECKARFAYSTKYPNIQGNKKEIQIVQKLSNGEFKVIKSQVY
jgi:hypothetical protein